MAKAGQSKKKQKSVPTLFITSEKKHPRLFLPKMLEQAASAEYLTGAGLDTARDVLLKWADLAEKGHLNQKETSLDAEFLEKVFGDALGYKAITESPEDYHREKSYTVTGAGIADGALGRFESGKSNPPVAIIELKGADTDLDHDKFNGRTPVQQCWDYLNQLPQTQWGIVSNYVTIRLYHRDSPARAYEEFTFADFRDENRLREFYAIFHRDGLLGNKVQAPRAASLLNKSQARQQEVGDILYNDYSNQRLALIEHLITQKGMSQDEAIHAAQKLLDRIIFVAFCEDRNLMPERLLERTYKQKAGITMVTNPRWQNFKSLFWAVDKGYKGEDIEIDPFNGGLFRNDPSVDNLDLEDNWTEFFQRVGTYDFRHEVNVEVLGHLFERSVTELEKLRVVGLFGKQQAGGSGSGQPAMPTSALRKRFGIYYTPPPFTRLIVERTLGEIIAERVDSLDDLDARVTELRKIKCIDPACGSGAFLIAAYDKFEEAYESISRAMRIDKRMKDAAALDAAFPEYILSENLYGVDLSAESVEISQLALWIRSARKGRTLANLSSNIVWGNSLVDDAAVHPRALTWRQRFASVYNRPESGFDAVIGNPPWERMKLQEREFFSLARPDIAQAVSAADRKALIAKVPIEDPALSVRFAAAQGETEKYIRHVRSSNRYPLTGRGDINTYMVFAELARMLVAPHGRVGLLVPSGIATDDTTKHFFNDLTAKKALIAIYDFENRRPSRKGKLSRWFPDVDGRFQFSVLLVGGSAVNNPEADFVFCAHEIEELAQPSRHLKLSDKDLALLNPNTKTCPVFASAKDAKMTTQVYRNVPVLVDTTRQSGGNPWGISFQRMFDQTTDAEAGKFKMARELKADGFKLDGNRWRKGKHVFLPVYEAKMIQAYDHRAASIVVVEENWMRQGQTEPTSLVQHQNPDFTVQPRFWADEMDVTPNLDAAPAMMAYKDVTSASNQRTMIAAMMPKVGMMNSAPIIRTGPSITDRRRCCLLANLNSLAYDFVARQKVGGTHLNYFIVRQLPAFAPDRYDDPCPWDKKTTLEDWVAERVIKLSCTCNEMIPLAKAAGFAAKVHKWKPDERAKLVAELDAAFLILYGFDWDDVDYILTGFQGVVDEDKEHAGVGPTRRLLKEAFDDLSGSKA